MVEENKNLLEVLSDFISNSDALEEEEKLKFKALLDSLSQGKIDDIDAEVANDLNQFLELEMGRAEDAAIVAGDPELISMFADLRNAKIEFVKKALQIEPAEERMGEVDKQVEQQTAGES